MDIPTVATNAAVAVIVGLAAWGAKGRFQAIDARFDSVDGRFDAVDARFDRADHRMDRLEDKIDAVRADLTQVALAVGAKPRTRNA